MRGPQIIARTLSVERPFGPGRRRFQYHSRSDHHSKVCCWAIAFDLLRSSAVLRRHALEDKIVLGVNHTMRDFRNSRRKNLDLVIARPGRGPRDADTSFRTLGERIGVVLDDDDRAELQQLPDVKRGPAAVVLAALEAKAAATEHKKAESRMFDELNSSQSTVHGAAEQAIAIGLALVNTSPTFVSPGRQRRGATTNATQHRQPEAAASLIRKLRELPRRAGPGSIGFDALGILAIHLRNDGSAVTLVPGEPGPSETDTDSYDAMIVRAASTYDYRFASQ